VDPTDHLISLREAIFYVSVDAAIDSEILFDNTLFSSGPAKITVSEGQLAIFTDLTITGPGAEQLTLDAEQKSRVFFVRGDSIDVVLHGLIITGGKTTGNGGGLYSDSTLTVSQSRLTGNVA